MSAQFAIANGEADNRDNIGNSTVLFAPKWGAMFIGEADHQPNKYANVMWDLTASQPLYVQYSANGAQKMAWNQYGGYFGGAARVFALAPSADWMSSSPTAPRRRKTPMLRNRRMVG